MFFVEPPPPPPVPGTPLEEYLKSVGGAKFWPSWDRLWNQRIGAYAELPQPQRYGIVVDDPKRYGDGEEVYVFPIELQTKEIIWGKFKGHRRAFEKLADITKPEDSVSFSLLTVMLSLYESGRVDRSHIPSDQFEEFKFWDLLFGNTLTFTIYGKLPVDTLLQDLVCPIPLMKVKRRLWLTSTFSGSGY
ncbi:MAG: hypothetical protein IH955_05940 [Chloroflexi bacterium]|nr:hypothetical protein [Chloroflexota bacterium]